MANTAAFAKPLLEPNNNAGSALPFSDGQEKVDYLLTVHGFCELAFETTLTGKNPRGPIQTSRKVMDIKIREDACPQPTLSPSDIAFLLTSTGKLASAELHIAKVMLKGCSFRTAHRLKASDASRVSPRGAVKFRARGVLAAVRRRWSTPSS